MLREHKYVTFNPPLNGGQLDTISMTMKFNDTKLSPALGYNELFNQGGILQWAGATLHHSIDFEPFTQRKCVKLLPMMCAAHAPLPNR